MVEQPKPSLGIGNDDCNSPVSIRSALRLKLPVQASVIVTGVREYMPVEQLVRDWGRQLRTLWPVIHVALLRGDFRKDNRKLFGECGALHAWLHAYENAHPEDSSRHFRSEMNQRLSNALERHEQYVIDEIHSQFDYWRKIFGREAYGASYHDGIHYGRRLNTLFIRACRERDLSYRYASQYVGTPRRQHVAVCDALNHDGVNQRAVLRELTGIEKTGEDTEITVHLGQFPYGWEQVQAFMNPQVRTRLFTHFK